MGAAAALLFSQGFTDPAAVRASLEQTAQRLGGAPGGEGEGGEASAAGATPLAKELASRSSTARE